MNTRSVLCALISLLPLALFAGPDGSLLILGNPVRTSAGETIFKGSASAIFKSGAAIEVLADEIVFEQRGGKNFLKCSGDTTVRIAGRTTKGKDLIVELGDSSQNIYMLNPNGIVMGNTATTNTGGFYQSEINKGFRGLLANPVFLYGPREIKFGPSESVFQNLTLKSLPMSDMAPSTKQPINAPTPK